jgi:hypothetical protein
VMTRNRVYKSSCLSFLTFKVGARDLCWAVMRLLQISACEILRTGSHTHAQQCSLPSLASNLPFLDWFSALGLSLTGWLPIKP